MRSLIPFLLVGALALSVGCSTPSPNNNTNVNRPTDDAGTRDVPTNPFDQQDSGSNDEGDVVTDEPDTPDPNPDAIQAYLDEQVAEGFEGAWLVVVGGEVRYSGGSGTLSEDSTQAPNIDTAFDVGSIMKDVTAALIFLLEADGVLSRDSTLSSIFDDVPEVWADVTLDHLLFHEAGFDEYHDTQGDFEAMDRDTALGHIFAQAPLFTPGTEDAYSNTGYTLLAIVIEVVTGGDFRALARERIFAPLGMTRTGFYGDASWDDGNVAVGRGGVVFMGNNPAEWPEPTWALIGNGGLVSTMNDLVTFAQALRSDALFDAETAEAFQDEVLGGEEMSSFAGGNDYGFNAYLAISPKDEVYIAIGSHVDRFPLAEHVGLVVGGLLLAPE